MVCAIMSHKDTGKVTSKKFILTRLMELDQKYV